MYICNVFKNKGNLIPIQNRLKIEIMITTGYTYQPKQTQGGKPTGTGMLYLNGSDEII